MNVARKRFVLMFALGALAVVIAPCPRAENWPQWRGPFFNGSTSEQGLPTSFSKTERFCIFAGDIQHEPNRFSRLPGRWRLREQYGRRGESIALWLVRRDAIHSVTEWSDEFDLKYRRVDGYSIKARLKEARERASARAR